MLSRLDRIIEEVLYRSELAKKKYGGVGNKRSEIGES